MRYNDLWLAFANQFALMVGNWHRAAGACPVYASTFAWALSFLKRPASRYSGMYQFCTYPQFRGLMPRGPSPHSTFWLWRIMFCAPAVCHFHIDLWTRINRGSTQFASAETRWSGWLLRPTSTPECRLGWVDLKQGPLQVTGARSPFAGLRTPLLRSIRRSLPILAYLILNCLFQLLDFS